jgi:hypothetical protein
MQESPFCQPSNPTYNSLLFGILKNLSIFVAVRARSVPGQAVLQCRPGDTFRYRTRPNRLVST